MSDLYSAGLRRRLKPSPVQRDAVFGKMLPTGPAVKINATIPASAQGLRRKPVKPITGIIGVRG